MTDRYTDGQAAGRLPQGEIQANFADIHPPLTRAQAAIEAERCYYCYDAPCTTACPTGIDIPSFIQRIANDDLPSSAKKIFEENIFGGMCARVCPTETLCEEACVRNLNEDQPVKIGLLQRHATDHALAEGRQFFERAPSTGRTVAVVGAGPAGLACAHRLAMLGHDVKVYEAAPKPGGLNEYGIAAYKVVDSFAQREIDYIMAIGGIEIVHGQALGAGLTLDGLADEHDAVFVGVGLGDVHKLGVEGEELEGVMGALDFINQVRQADDLGAVEVGRRVVVIGGGMTAVDAASQALRLGAEEATIVYRRGAEQMPASAKELRFVQNTGVQVRFWARPKSVSGDGKAEQMEFEYTELRDGKLAGTGAGYTLAADMVLVAAGQQLEDASAGWLDGLETDGGRLKVDAERRTSRAGVWAGGDCIADGEDLTVWAVEDGKAAAMSIDRSLRGNGG